MPFDLPSCDTLLPPQFSRDIDTYIGQAIDDYTKRVLLENPWTPPANYQYPFSTRTLAGKQTKNYVSMKHLNT